VAILAGASGALVGLALAWAVWSGAFGSRPQPGRLLDLDLATGAVRFDIQAHTASVHLHTLGDDLVVVTGADDCGVPAHHEEIYAYTLPSGTLRWQRGSPGVCLDDAPLRGTSASYPSRSADRVTIVGTPPGPASNTATYAARDARTGRTLWRKQRRTTTDDPTGQLKAISDGLALFVQPETDLLQAFALRSGDLRWTHHLRDWRPGGHDQVIAGEGAVAVIGQGAISVLDARSGRARWTKPLPTDDILAHAPAAILNGQILIPSTSSGYGPLFE
jgi:outer membrane protein assembly factor BamB